MISKGMFMKILQSPKFMTMKKINPYTNLLDHHIHVCINLLNGTTPLTIPWLYKKGKAVSTGSFGVWDLNDAVPKAVNMNVS